MIIETKKLINFLSTVRMNELEIVKLRFEEEGLKVVSDSNANTHQVNAFLLKKAFIEYEPIGNVGVDDLSRLISVLKSLGDETNFSVDGNILQLKNKNKKVEVELVSEKFVPTPQQSPNIDFETTATIDSKDIKEVLNDIKNNKNAIIKIRTVDEGLEIMTKGKYTYTYRYDTKGTTAGVNVSFGNPLVNALSQVNTGTVVLNLSSDAPVLVENQDGEFNCLFFVAPRTNE